MIAGILELRSNSPLQIAIKLLKALVWTGFALGVVGLLALVFDLMPFNLDWPRRIPGAIEGRLSGAEVRYRTAALRDFASSPQAAATAADSLTIVGVEFDRLREGASGKAASAGRASGPFAVRLNLKRSFRTAVVAITDQPVAWTIIPPRKDWPQAVFGLESKLFPEFRDTPSGVLAGFRIDAAGGDVAKPLRPDEGPRRDVANFCRSIADWATHFSVPLDSLKYVLVEDPTSLAYDGNGWISDGNILLELANDELRSGCTKFYGEAWRK